MSEEPAEESVEADEAATDEHEAPEDEAEAEDASGVQAGDVIRVDLTAYTAENGMLVDTTDPEVAEEEGVDDDREIEPRVVILGEGHLFDAVEEALYGLEPGDTTEVTVSAAEAFGEHNPDQVRTVGSDKIPEDDRYPGAFVEVDGDQGVVETIIGGRARVDFNHPFAGEDIEYELEVLEWLDDREELARGLIRTFLDLDLEVWFETEEVEEEQLVEPDEEDEDDESAEPEYETVTVEKESLYIEATPQLSMNQQWLFGKQQIASELTNHLDVDRVVVQEIIESPQQALGQAQDFLGGEGLEDIEDIEEELEEDLDLEDELEE